MPPPAHLQKNLPPAAPPPKSPDWIVPAIIVAVGLVLAPVAFLGVRALLSSGGTIDAGTGAVDSNARIELEMLRQQVEDLQNRMKAAEDQISALASRPAPDTDVAALNSGEIGNISGENTLLDSYAQVVLLAGRRINNEGMTVPSPDFQVATFGMPRDSLSDDCEPITNETLKARLVTEDVGPIRVSMLKPAVESLHVVFEKIKAADEDLYKRINTAGALCVRRIRGSSNSVSSHSFGTAVDLNIDGVLDTLGDGKTQLGLTILADFFQAEGWFWGAAFSREDSMHFEVSKEKIEQWKAEGKI